MKKIAFFIFALSLSIITAQSFPEKSEFTKQWSAPKQTPDHILLNLSGDPSSSISVSWRTSRQITLGFGEIAIAKADAKFVVNAKRIEAKTTNLKYSNVVNNYLTSKKTFKNLNHNYHSVTFEDLEPNTTYAYRVGDGKYWSEWIQFTTADKYAIFIHICW